MVWSKKPRTPQMERKGVRVGVAKTTAELTEAKFD